MRRLFCLAGAWLSITTATAPAGLADPVPNPGDPSVVPAADATPAPPVPTGPLPSGPPGPLTTPEGLVLKVSAAKESLDPVTALTNTPWSREYLVSGVFSGTASGPGQSALQGGVLEAGYQIGCGITQQDLHSISTLGLTPGIGIPILDGEGALPVFLNANASEQVRVVLEPGRVNIVSVTKKTFEGDWARVSITGLRVKVDGCAGQSFIRSFATFTSSTKDDANVVTYLGVTRAV